MNIYIGNFSNDVTEEDLRAAFEAFGQVTEVKLIKDKFTGASRGFAFVEMPSKKEAAEAMDGIRDLNLARWDSMAGWISSLLISCSSSISQSYTSPG